MPFYILFVKKTPTTNRKSFIKKRNILINLEKKMKINKNQIRIMFVLKKNLSILEIGSLILENLRSHHNNAIKIFRNILLLGTLPSYYNLIIFISPKFPDDNLFSV